VLPVALVSIFLIASNYRVGEMESEHFSFEYRGYGNNLRREGRLDEAIEQYRAAVRVGGEHAQPHLALGMALAERGRSQEAIASFSEVVRIEPDSARGWMNLGAQHLGQDQVEEAITAFRMAVRVDPTLGEAHHNLVVALVRAGRGEEAKFHRSEARRLRRREIGADP
jgi:Flp pilus assembly protein TadD